MQWLLYTLYLMLVSHTFVSYVVFSRSIAMAAFGYCCSVFLDLEGRYVNGTTIPVDGGLWLSKPRHLAKDAVKQISRAVEKRSRDKPVGVPSSKL